MSLPSIVSTPTGSVFSSGSRAASRTQSVTTDQRFLEVPTPEGGSRRSSVSVGSSVSSSGTATPERAAEAGGLAWLLAYGLDSASLARLGEPVVLVDGREVAGDPQVCLAWREAQRVFRVSGGDGVGFFSVGV